MRKLMFLMLLAGCTGNGNDNGPDADPLRPGNTVDAGTSGEPDAAPTGNPAGKRAGAACATGAECAGGTCLGAPGQPEDGNNRFTGGYCTHVGCTPDSQTGCGADEWCIDAGNGGICLEMCSKADGLTCDRADHVCLGLGTFGGCFSKDTVECNPRDKGVGCNSGEVCIKIGFEDHTLGRCETSCDPMENTCPTARSCYYIRAYDAAFCNVPGTLKPDDQCTCDKCCGDGYACTPDLDGSGRHCKPYCELATGDGCQAGSQCVPLKKTDAGVPVGMWGGCVAPGSAGTK